MSVLQLFILAGAAIPLGRLKRGRTLALLAVSVFTIYWLQAFNRPLIQPSGFHFTIHCMLLKIRSINYE